MSGGGDAQALMRELLAERLGEQDLDWLDESASLAAQGVGSLDLIAVLARLQRETGIGLTEEAGIDEGTTLASLAAALRPLGPVSEGA
jgi:acyl carrier protein